MDSLWSSSASSGELLPVHVYVFPPAGGEASVNQLDILFFSLSCLTVYHAYLQKDRKEHLTLALSGFLLGLSTEQASLRFGGTHCHASGWAHFHECSSINSVLFYCPWVHTGALCAKRMVDQKSWAFPYVAGALFFGMCGVYESQGPMMGWWLWPKPDMIVKVGCDIWKNGDLGDDARGLVASKYAYDVLYTRIHGCPALAPYFHFAFGWGIAKAYQ